MNNNTSSSQTGGGYELSWSQTVEENHPLENDDVCWPHSHRSHGASQEPSQTQMTEILTQNAELTQLGDDDEDDACDDEMLSSSPLPTTAPMVQPWGRLMPCSATGTGSIVPLLPRGPEHESNNNDHLPNSVMVTLLPPHPLFFLEQITPQDIFNEYTMGRSNKCDIRTEKPHHSNKKLQARHEWAYGMISNQHCKMYCTLDASMCTSSCNSSSGRCCAEDAATTVSAMEKLAVMQVWIEDCSGNGTVINQTTVLRKGEKRLLHSGDEICLVHKNTLLKKIRASSELSHVTQQHSYVYVHCVTAPTTAFIHNTNTTNKLSLMTAVTQRSGFSAMPHPQRKSAVDARATKSSSWRNNKNSHTEGGSGGGLETLSTQQQQPLRGRKDSVSSTGNNSISKSPHPHHPSGRRISPRRLPPRRIQQDYDIRDLLGTGTTGEVRRAIHRVTGREVAVKIIGVARNRAAFLSTQTTTELQAEASILQQLSHPYVIQLYDVYTCANHTAIYLVMELLPGGDLFDRIVAKGQYSETDSRRVTRRLLAAVHYLHQTCNLVHRDLKPENILLTSATSDIHVKLTDFGLAKLDGDLKTFCGTPQYFAPEVLRRRHTVKGVGRYGKQADMWSLGVILYVLLTGTPPFDAADAGLPTTIDFPEHVSADARDLVVQLLQQDPRQRVTVVQACEHAWILQEDGDTHVHPLNDPHLVMTADGNTDMTRRFSVPDCIGNHQSLTNDNVDEALQPLGTSSDTTTIATADGVKESGTWNSSLPVDAAAMRFATSALTDNCGAAPDGVPPVRASERSVDVCDVLIRENPSPFTKDRSLHEQASKSSEKPTICVSAINFSFREQSPMRSASYNKHKDNSILDMVSRKPLSPVSLNEATGAPLSSSSSNTPKPSIVSEQARPQNADAHTVEPAIDDQAWALVATATKRGDPANAITPGASNLRLSAPLEQVVRLPFAASRNSDNRSDDDIRSKFTENTDSISSFSTVPAGELDENLELSLKIEGSDKKVTKIAGRSGSSSSKPKKSSNEAFASHATGKKTGTKNCSSATSKKRPGPARLKTNVTKKTKTGAIASPPTSNVCAATRRAGGGKQTTLNNWFKKHN